MYPRRLTMKFSLVFSRFFCQQRKVGRLLEKSSLKTHIKSIEKLISVLTRRFPYNSSLAKRFGKKIQKSFLDPMRFMFTFSKYTLFINYESYPLVLDQESWTWVNLINLKFWNKMLGFWDEIREEMSCVISLSLF